MSAQYSTSPTQSDIETIVPEGHPEKSSRERKVVLGLVLVFLFFNILTATYYPFPNVDEAMIAEPAINFLHGLGFRIRFSEIVVLYSFLLVPWLKLFGSTLEAIRSASAVCMSAALYLLWSATARLGIIRGSFWRLLLLGLLVTEYGMIFAFRYGRYDAFGVLLMAIAIWIMSVEKKEIRLACLALFSLLIPWAGPQYLPLLFVALLLIVIVFRKTYLREVGISVAGVVFGGAIFLTALSVAGRLKTFFGFAGSQQRSVAFVEDLILHGKFDHGNYIPKDPSFPFLFVATLLLLYVGRGRNPKVTRKVMQFGILFAVLFTVVMLAVAKFPSYYSYMVVVPISIALCSGLSFGQSGAARKWALTLCALSATAGAGLNAASYLAERQDHEYARIQRFVDYSIRSEDVAYVEPVAYVQVRQKARDAYFPSPDLNVIAAMSREQRASVDVVIVRPEWGRDILRAFGGNWYYTGERLPSLERGMFGGRDFGFVSWTFGGLQVYRKTSSKVIPISLMSNPGLGEDLRQSDEILSIRPRANRYNQ